MTALMAKDPENTRQKPAHRKLDNEGESLRPEGNSGLK